MGRKRKWTDEKIQKLIKLVEDGRSYADLSKELNQTESSVRRRLSKLRQEGYPELFIRVRNPHYWLAREDEVLINCARQGKTLSQTIRKVRQIKGFKRNPATVIRRLATLRRKDPTLPVFEIKRHPPTAEEHQKLKELLRLPRAVNLEMIKSILDEYNDWAIDLELPFRLAETLQNWVDDINSKCELKYNDIPIQDLAIALGCHEATVQDWCKKGWLKYKKKGIQYFTTRKDIKNLFRNHLHILKNSLRPKGNFIFLMSLLGWL